MKCPKCHEFTYTRYGVLTDVCSWFRFDSGHFSFRDFDGAFLTTNFGEAARYCSMAWLEKHPCSVAEVRFTVDVISDDRTREAEQARIKAGALAKLSPEEKKALGL